MKIKILFLFALAMATGACHWSAPAEAGAPKNRIAVLLAQSNPEQRQVKEVKKLIKQLVAKGHPVQLFNRRGEQVTQFEPVSDDGKKARRRLLRARQRFKKILSEELGKPSGITNLQAVLALVKGKLGPEDREVILFGNPLLSSQSQASSCVTPSLFVQEFGADVLPKGLSWKIIPERVLPAGLKLHQQAGWRKLISRSGGELVHFGSPGEISQQAPRGRAGRAAAKTQELYRFDCVTGLRLGQASSIELSWEGGQDFDLSLYSRRKGLLVNWEKPESTAPEAVFEKDSRGGKKYELIHLRGTGFDPNDLIVKVALYRGRTSGKQVHLKVVFQGKEHHWVIRFDLAKGQGSGGKLNRTYGREWRNIDFQELINPKAGSSPVQLALSK